MKLNDQQGALVVTQTEEGFSMQLDFGTDDWDGDNVKAKTFLVGLSEFLQEDVTIVQLLKLGADKMKELTNND